MMRQLADVIAETAGVERFDRPADSLVQTLAAVAQKRLIGDFLRKDVLEGVNRLVLGRLCINKIRMLQLGQHPVQARPVGAADCSDKVQRQA